MPDSNIATHSPTRDDRGGRAAPFRRVAQRQQHREQRHRHHQRDDGDVRGVDDRDHHERAEVVDDGERQQEHAQPGRRARREQRQRAEREGGVGGHRRAPAVGAGAARVEREVDRHRDAHAAERGDHGDRQAPALAQLAEVELALGLQPDDEEEERHQPLVDPVAQVGRDAAAPRRVIASVVLHSDS